MGERTLRPRDSTPEGREAGGLSARLVDLDGAPYPAYRGIKGLHELGPCRLEFLTIQPDPFAPASRARVTVPLEDCGVEPDRPAGPASLAAEDFLGRVVDEWLRRNPDVSAVVRIDPPSQQILRRTATRVSASSVELLLAVDLPGRGRRIDGRRADRALAHGIPRLVRESLLRGSWDLAALRAHSAALEDHRCLARQLGERGWVAFVAEGAILPRRSGEEDVPLAGAVPFEAPPDLADEVVLPHAGRVRGMPIPEGVTLLCGGGFHGKSTLLRALAAAVYPHIPGDGRERIAADPTAMIVRAEDGRAIHGVDLSPFLAELPDGTDPRAFTTNNASGSTSQAAGIVEALEIGCRCLLIDEDTSATNFLLRDPWMARLLPARLEPIRHLLGRLHEILDRFGASTVLVVGGSGEAFRVADRAIVMHAYRPENATRRLRELQAEMGAGQKLEAAAWDLPARSVPILRSAHRRAKARAIDQRRLRVGSSEIDLSASGALVHPSQVRLLAEILNGWLDRGLSTISMPGDIATAADSIASRGPAVVSSIRGDLAEVRIQEIAMMASRIRPQRMSRDDGNRGTRDGIGGYGSA